MPYLELNYFVLSETKINDTLRSSQFNVSDYEIKTRRDRDGKEDEMIDYVKRKVICKWRKEFKTTISESMCSALITSKKKWFCMSIYRPYNYNDLSTFWWNKLIIN